MPTKIYYKEVPSEDDPDVMEPVLIDTLFKAKESLSDGNKVPESKETGIKEIKIDLSNLFELADKETKPSVLAASGERTFIYVGSEGKDFIKSPAVESVSKELLHRYTINGYSIPANLTIEVPPAFRDRWLFYKTEARYGGFNCYPSGGYIPPGTSSFQVKSPALLLYEIPVALCIDLHEITLVEDAERLRDAGFVDLSDIFACKGEEFTGWWQPLLYLTGRDYNLNYYDDDGWITHSHTVFNLPKAEFTYRVVGGQWYHSNFFYRDWVTGIKAEGVTQAPFSFQSPGAAWVFGLHPSQLDVDYDGDTTCL